MFNLPTVDDNVNVPYNSIDKLNIVECLELNFLHVDVRSLGKHWALINTILNENLYKYILLFTEINLKTDCTNFYFWDEFDKSSQ